MCRASQSALGYYRFDKQLNQLFKAYQGRAAVELAIQARDQYKTSGSIGLGRTKRNYLLLDLPDQRAS